MHAETVEGHKGLAVSAERKVAEGQAAMATAASYRDAAKERRERLQRGEDVPGGLGNRSPERTPHASFARLAGARATSSTAST